MKGGREAGKRGKPRNGKIAVGEADSGLKPAEDVHDAPLTDHPPPQVRRIAAGGSRLFVAPAGRLVQKGRRGGSAAGRGGVVNGRLYRPGPDRRGGASGPSAGARRSDADALRAGIISWKLEQ